jgi:O-antigen/teichoic acid export membrane protein
MQGSRSVGRGALGSGVLTGISTAAVSGSAAILGVILSRKFGHGVRTDGFFAAYGVYLAVVLVAGALRVVVLPRFVAARAEERLAHEMGAWTAGLALPLAAVLVLSVAWPHGLASALTSNPAAREQAAELLPWVVPSAVAQVYGGLVASALAAFDDYASAAFGFAAGSVCGVVLTLALVGHGVIAFGWGLALNGALSLAIPLVPLLRHGAVGAPDRRPWGRLLELGEGIALPIALQGLYVVAYRFASGLGAGRATTFSYAYLIAAFLVAVTATSIALVSTVPLAREGASPERVAHHVVATAWLSLVPVAAAAGVFALAGEPVVRHVLGSSYGGGTGAELGRLVGYLAPWMVASIVVTVAYPIVFVRGRARWLPALAVGALAVQVLVEWAAQAAFGLGGVAAGLAVTTAGVVVVLLGALHALRRTLAGVLVAALVCGLVAVAAFGLPRLVLGPFLAAVLGLIAYTVVLGAWRPAGLRHAWAYLRTLE